MEEIRIKANEKVKMALGKLAKNAGAQEMGDELIADSPFYVLTVKNDKVILETPWGKFVFEVE